MQFVMVYRVGFAALLDVVHCRLCCVPAWWRCGYDCVVVMVWVRVVWCGG